MLLYYITDRRQFPGGEREQRRRLLAKIAEAAAAGIDFIQLRERDLTVRDLEGLAVEAVAVVRSSGAKTRLLINSRIDVALAAGADGVHLRSDDIAASDARAIAGSQPSFVVGVSCHSVEEVRSAWSHGADFSVFGPVFEKEGRQGTGVEGLRSACKLGAAVLALGGVSIENAGTCVSAGAVGIAGIRIYQENDICELVKRLRSEAARPKSG